MTVTVIVTSVRLILGLCLCLTTMVGCTPHAAAPPDTPSPPPPTTMDEVQLSLSTDRPHVVSVVLNVPEPEGEPLEPTETGTLSVTSTQSGVMVVIDGGDPVALPLNIDLPAGEHTLEATCPDGYTESLTPVVHPAEETLSPVCVQ